MNFSVSISTILNSSLERAFRTPMLCDVSKVHTGMGPMPRITRVSDDLDWGKPGKSKKVYAAKSWTQKGGYVSKDTVIERRENEYWKIEVSDFQSWMLSFYKFTGEWAVSEIDPKKVQLTYTYTLHFSNPIYTPFTYLFVKFFWKIYMKQVIKNIQKMIDNSEPYLYE